MVLTDDRILEFLRESEHAKSATQMHDSGMFNRSRPTISQRLQKLSDAGLVRVIGNGMYVLTKEGEAYLDEEYHVEKGVYLNDEQADESNGPTAGEGVGEL